MNSRLFFILIALIIVSGGAYFWWNTRPEQQVKRQTEEFLDAVRYEKLSLKKREDRHKAFQELFTPKVEFSGKGYFPNEALELPEILSKLDEFHSMITLCELTETERTIAVDGDEARVDLELDIKVASGPNFKKKQKWSFTLFYQKEDRWRVFKISGMPR